MAVEAGTRVDEDSAIELGSWFAAENSIHSAIDASSNDTLGFGSFPSLFSLRMWWTK